MAKKKKRRQRRCAGGYFIGSTMGYYSSPARKTRRKTFRTKAAAKKNMPAYESVYKVKGGWRRSKKREPAPF